MSQEEANDAEARQPSPLVARSFTPVNTGRPRRNRRPPAYLQDYVTDTVCGAIAPAIETFSVYFPCIPVDFLVCRRVL